MVSAQAFPRKLGRRSWTAGPRRGHTYALMASIIFIALALSMDAFAVSVSAGICNPQASRAIRLRAALFFGLFQALMPLAGWALASLMADEIRRFDHWLAFGLLAFIGGKMSMEATRELGRREKAGEAGDVCDAADAERFRSGGITKIRSLTLLALATSIDALAVGVTFSVFPGNPFLNAAVIGAVTFGVCAAGLSLGKRIGNRFGEIAEIFGGMILVGIGIKILAQHLGAGPG